MSGIKTVVFIIAMEAEAQPFVEHMGLSKDGRHFAEPATCVSYSGKHGNLDVHVVVNGKCITHGVDYVGTVPAGLTTFLACQTFKPDLVINAGTAGGFKSMGAAIGDVYVSTAAVNHDRRIPLPGFEAYGVGREAAAPVPNLARAVGLKEGVVTTGNSLDYHDRDMENMVEAKASVKDMEAAAIKWAAVLHKVPCICIKSVTDIVDGDRVTSEEFLENLGAAAKSLQETLPKILDFVDGKKLEEL